MEDGGGDLLAWLRTAISRYEFDVVAAYRRRGDHDWPLVASDEDGLVSQLEAGGHLLPLPKEPAALANVIEVSLVDFLLGQVADLDGATAVRGTERGYPDIEIGGPHFGGGFHAVDVKVAKRNNARTQTQSRITLYTGNTYFQWPTLKWPGMFRPFSEYASHLDAICIYTLDESSSARVTDLEIVVHEPWRIASQQRSSTTREYIGAVTHLDALREGRGEFDTADQFYSYWRNFNFRISKQVQRQLQKLLKDQGLA